MEEPAEDVVIAVMFRGWETPNHFTGKRETQGDRLRLSRYRNDHETEAINRLLMQRLRDEDQQYGRPWKRDRDG